MTETRYQHGFTSPSPWWRPTDATRRRWSACSRDRLRWRAGLRGGGGRASRGGRRRRCARRAGGGAPGWQRDAVSTRSDGRRRRAEALVIATASWWRAGMRGEAVERWGRRKVTTLRLPRWRRRSGLAARCCVHKERWATPSRQSTRSGGRHLRWRRRHARRGRRVWGRRRETGRWWARSSRGRRVHETKQILIQGVLQKCAFWKASRCDM